MIDSESTCNLFCNCKFGKRVYRDRTSINVEGTGGIITADQKLEIDYLDVDPWFDKKFVDQHPVPG